MANWLDFIANIVDSLAWPAAIVFIVLIFRQPLQDLFPNLKKLKYKDFEAEFGEELEALKSITPPEISADEDGDDALSDLKSRLISLSNIAPNAAVLEAWRAVEKSAKDLIARNDVVVDYDVAAPYRLIQKIMREKKILPAAKIRVFNELRKLRNKVAHAEGYEITSDQAEDYINLSVSIISEMDLL